MAPPPIVVSGPADGRLKTPVAIQVPATSDPPATWTTSPWIESCPSVTEIVPVLSTCTVEWMYVKFPPDFTNDPWFTNRSNPPPDVPCMYALTKFHEPSLVTTAASSNVTTDEASWRTVPVFVNPTPLMIGVTEVDHPGVRDRGHGRVQHTTERIEPTSREVQHQRRRHRHQRAVATPPGHHPTPNAPPRCHSPRSHPATTPPPVTPDT